MEVIQAQSFLILELSSTEICCQNYNLDVGIDFSSFFEFNYGVFVLKNEKVMPSEH